MRRASVLCATGAAILILVALGCGREQDREGDGTLTTSQDSMSYALGMRVADYVERLEANVDHEEVVKGLRDAMRDQSRLTPEQKGEIMGEFIQQMRAAASRGEQATLPKDASYAIGMDVASYVRNEMPDELNTDLVVRGLRDSLGEGVPQLTRPVMQDLVERLDTQRQADMQSDFTARGDQARARGQQFLEQNRQQPGVRVTPSGLHFQVLQEGTGATPGPEDQVTVHYQGELVDGTVFDSSYQRGEPITFPVRGVIAGWTEALQMMKVGGRYRLVLPPELAYGEQGAGGTIGPNETLVFEVELIGIAGR